MNSWHLFVTRRQAAQMQQLVLTVSVPEEVRETVIERVDWREWLFHARAPIGYRLVRIDLLLQGHELIAKRPVVRV